MRSQIRAALVGVLVIGAPLAVATAAAAARTAGKASFRGQIIAPARGGHRTVVSSIIVFRGVFNGIGRVVEVSNRPGDPETVSRDNLVLQGGTMHLRSTIVGAPQFTLDPVTCAYAGRIGQIAKVEGGTGKFRHASGTFKGTVRAYGVAARNGDGSCTQQADPPLEADVVVGRGTLSY